RAFLALLGVGVEGGRQQLVAELRGAHQHGSGDGRGGADRERGAQPGKAEPAGAPAPLGPLADRREGFGGGLDRVGLGAQCRAEAFLEALVERVGHVVCSSTERRSAIPRAVWLFTAPRPIPIALAIWASARSP